MPDFLTATIWQVGGGSGSSSLYRQFQAAAAAGRQIHTPGGRGLRLALCRFCLKLTSSEAQAETTETRKLKSY